MSLSRPRGSRDFLNYRLSRLLNASGAMVVRLCEGRYGITRREWRVIALLAEEGAMSPSGLAERTHLERGRVSALITQLVAKDLLQRQAVAGDARRAEVSLSEKGRALYDELLPQSAAFNREVLDALSAEEQDAFDAMLQKLTEAAERLAATRPVPEKADRRHGGARRLRPR
ncbi:MarR family transcriptional regulator [Ramlibacter sp. USB13]|uniref:MarR family transcriptional regulator n=1 Tax=Ramlibacter cellulosilyticus TaxID=2764187 RepID=A0A923MKM2_9BURK|nr:MarR family transcriptional regulator [Ramlibacter cellulosilyticus]MBC5781352.1 MarR family transcriptional regulator [Ramlibacter cellulosilyticus]